LKRKRGGKKLNEKLKKNMETGARNVKLFTAVIYGFSKKARVFVPDKPFQPSLLFVIMVRRLP